MISINEPANGFRDYNNLIACLGQFDTEDRLVNQMPKADAIRSASQQGSVHIITKAYSLSIYFTLKGVTIREYAYKLLKYTFIKNEDMEGFEIAANNLILYVRNFEKYGFARNTIHINLEDIDLSSPELVDDAAIKKHYRKNPDMLYGAKLAKGYV